MNENSRTVEKTRQKTYPKTSTSLNSTNGMLISNLLSKSLNSSPVLKTSALMTKLVPSTFVMSMLMTWVPLSLFDSGVRLLTSHSILFVLVDSSTKWQFDGVFMKLTIDSGSVTSICARYAVSRAFSMVYSMLIDELLPKMYDEL